LLLQVPKKGEERKAFAPTDDPKAAIVCDYQDSVGIELSRDVVNEVSESRVVQQTSKQKKQKAKRRIEGRSKKQGFKAFFIRISV
jgi:hypothetical protein